MLLQPGQIIFGVDAQLLRNAARRCPAPFTVEALCLALGAPASEVKKLVKKAVAAGWLNRVDNAEPVYDEAEDWARLRCSRIGKPVSRAKAKALVDQVVQGVRERNREAPRGATLACGLVTELWCFGSYLDESKSELGDIDLAAEAHVGLRAGRHIDDMRRIWRATLRAIAERSPLVSVQDLLSVKELATRLEPLYRAADDFALWFEGDDVVRAFPRTFLACVGEWTASPAAFAGLELVRASGELQRKVELARTLA
jgi:hypothetical protein